MPPPRFSRLRALEARLLEATDCTRLCVVLAGIGIGLSVAAAASTLALMREPTESVAAAVLAQHGAAHCAAIQRVLAGLALVRLNAVVGGHHWSHADQSADADRSSFGVVNLDSGTLEDVHGTRYRASGLQPLLAALPLLDPALRSAVPAPPSPALRGDLGRHGCSEFDDSLRPSAVRVYPLAAPAVARPADRSHSAARDHGSSHQSGASGPGEPGTDWLAFLYGPWRDGGSSRVAFALVDLRAVAAEQSGHRHGDGADAFMRLGHSYLRSSDSVLPLAALLDRSSLNRSVPGLDTASSRLSTLRLTPFANRLVVQRLWVDRRILWRSSRRAAAGVFLMGLVGTGLVVLVSRSSQMRLRQLNQALAKESRTDGLTQVANRRAWDEALEQAESRRRRHGETYGLVVVDLDGFKQINDSLGHKHGDAVLQRAAGALAGTLRSSDLLARVGGDEFAILLCRPDPPSLEDLIERLRAVLRDAAIAASVGGANSEPHLTLEQTWHQADVSMYLGKSRTSGDHPDGLPSRTAPLS